MRQKLQDQIDALRLEGVEVEVDPDGLEDILRERGVSSLGVILTRAITVAEWREEPRHRILLKREPREIRDAHDLAHEFGHFDLHRRLQEDFPPSVLCSFLPQREAREAYAELVRSEFLLGPQATRVKNQVEANLQIKGITFEGEVNCDSLYQGIRQAIQDAVVRDR